MAEVNRSMSPEEVVELKHTLDNMAELLRTYYDELRAKGFDRRESLAIVIGWQRVVILGQGRGDGE
jgi:hypothetical protein